MIIAILLAVALLSVPVLNTHYFKIEDLSVVRRDVRDRFEEIGRLSASGESRAAKESTMVLIERYSKRRDDISVTATQLAMFQLAATEQQTAVSVNDHDNAIKDFRKLLSKYPATPVAEQAFLMIARSYIAMGDMGYNVQTSYAEAIKSLEIIEQNRPEALNFPKYKFSADIKPGKYFNIDRGAVKLKNRDLTKQLYTRVEMMREMASDTSQVKAETFSDVVMLIGDCYTKMGKGDQARDQYRLIIDFFKESDRVDDAQKAIGDSYVKEADFLREAIGKETDEAARASLQAKQADLYRQAVDTYLKFLNVYLQSDLVSKVSIALGGVYFKLGRDKEAYVTFSMAINAIKVIEDQARVQLDIGTYYFNEKKWDDAIENYGKVLQNYSGTQYAANAQFLLGECYESKGDTLASIKAYGDLIENFRASAFYASAALKMGQYYIRIKDFAKAQQVLRQSISRFPESSVAPKTQFEIGRIYMQMAETADSTEAQTKYRLAIKEFETVVGQYDQSDFVEKAILEMGSAYMKLGNKEKARSTLDNLQDQQMIMEKFRILGVAGSDSAIIQDFEQQLSKFTEDQARALVYIEIGRKLMGEQLNLLDSAIATFHTAVRLARDSVTIITAYGELGNVYMKKGEFKKARQIYTDEVLENPRCDESRTIQFSFKVAETYFRDKTYDEAVKHFTAFTDKYPSNPLTPTALYILGKSQQMLSVWIDAKKTYQRIFDQFPKAEIAENAALGYAECLAGDKQYNEAVRYILGYLKKNPGIASTPSFYYKVADLYKSDLAKPDSAIHFFGRVLEFPDHFLFSGAAYFQGKLYADQGDDAKAIAAYEKVKKADFEYFRAAQGDIGSLKARTDPEGAIQNYEKIENGSDDVADKVMARMGIGDVYAAQKKYVEAVASYQVITDKYTTASPDMRSVAIVKIIDALNNAEKYGDIIQWSDRMLREFPGNRFTGNAVYFKANAYYLMKRYREARDIFKDVLLHDSGTLAEVAEYQRAECLLSMGDQPGAVKELNAFMAKRPKSGYVANVLFHLGNVEYGEENYPAAKKFYTRILGEYPQFPAICWVKNYLAFCYDKEGTWRKATAIYGEVRAGGCDKEAKQFAKEQIQAITVRH